MGPVWYRVRSELRARWPRAVGLALVVAAVGGLVLTLVAGVARTVTSPERYTAALGEVPDASLEQADGSPRTEEVASLPDVRAVHNATFVFGGIVAGDGVPVEGFVFAGDPRAFGARVAEGREPDPASPGEFAATRSWLAVTGAELGDELQLLTISGAQAAASGFDVAEPEGPTMAATLVGVLDGPNQLQDPTPLALFPATMLDAGDIGVASTVGVVRLRPGATVDDLRAQLDELPDGQDLGLGEARWVPDEVTRAVRAQGQGLAVVAAIVAVAGVAVLGQLMSRRNRPSDAQGLALTAIGLRPAQLVADPLGATAAPVLAGSLLACVVAYAASGLFPAGLAEQVEPSPGLRFDPLVHGLGPLVLAIALMAWVLVALVLGGREGGSSQRAGRLDLLVGRLRPGPAATGLRFALSRQPRDPGAVRAPLLGLVLVLALLAGALTFGMSVDRFLEQPARYGSNFDFATGAGGDAVPEEIRELLATDPDVTDVTLFGTRFAAVGSESLDVTGMEPLRGQLEPDLLTGRLPLRDDEMVLGRVSARALGLDVDDVVEVRGEGGLATFLVTGLAVIPSIEGGDGVGHGGLVTFDGLRRLDPDAEPSTAAVRLRRGAEGAIARLSEQLGVELGLPDRPSEVLNVQRIRSTPFLVAASLAALAVLSLAHQLMTSARRRRRDLAILRALGADRRWVTGVLHWQVTILVAVVGLVAIPLGVAAGRLVYTPYIDRLGAGTDLSVPVTLLAGLVVALLLLGNLAAVVPARRARRDVPATVLADE